MDRLSLLCQLCKRGPACNLPAIEFLRLQTGLEQWYPAANANLSAGWVRKDGSSVVYLSLVIVKLALGAGWVCFGLFSLYPASLFFAIAKKRREAREAVKHVITEKESF